MQRFGPPTSPIRVNGGACAEGKVEDWGLGIGVLDLGVRGWGNDSDITTFPKNERERGDESERGRGCVRERDGGRERQRKRERERERKRDKGGDREREIEREEEREIERERATERERERQRVT